MERLGSEAWQGVAQVDRGSASQLDGRWLATLVAGDTAALMVFAAIGRYSHFHDLDLLAISSIAAPFLLGELATVGTVDPLSHSTQLDLAYQDGMGRVRCLVASSSQAVWARQPGRPRGVGVPAFP